MPKMNIFIPVSLKIEMDRLDGRRGRAGRTNVNWSKIAQEAFHAELQRRNNERMLTEKLNSLCAQLGFGTHWRP